MTRRNLGTTAILAVATVLLIGGMAFAREAERRHTGDVQPTASAAASPSADDHGGDRAGSDDSALPTASAAASPSADDHGGDRAGSDESALPTASAAASPSADDHGGDHDRGDD